MAFLSEIINEMSMVLTESVCVDCGGGRSTVVHRLGYVRYILVEYIELTDKYSTRRGPPRDTGFLGIPVLILD